MTVKTDDTSALHFNFMIVEGSGSANWHAASINVFKSTLIARMFICAFGNVMNN